MRMEGYDWNAQLAKRFEVVSAQKIEGRWFLKQMRIEELQPGTNRVQSRTYLEIKRWGRCAVQVWEADGAYGQMRSITPKKIGRAAFKARALPIK